MTTKFGNLDENGNLIPAPPSLRIEMTFPPEEEGGEPITGIYNVANPTAEQYRDAGYYPIREAAMPEATAGSHCEADYSMGDGEIVQVWVLVEDEPPEPPEPTLEDGLRILLGGE